MPVLQKSEADRIIDPPRPDIYCSFALIWPLSHSNDWSIVTYISRPHSYAKPRFVRPYRSWKLSAATTLLPAWHRLSLARYAGSLSPISHATIAAIIFFRFRFGAFSFLLTYDWASNSHNSANASF